VQVEIRETTNNIIIVTLSTRKPNFILKSPISSQVNEDSLLKSGLYSINILTIIMVESINVETIAKIETQSPCLGSFLPTNI
jgi:hypothetical protein